MRFILFCCSLFLALNLTVAQDHDIRIKIDGYSQDTLLIAYHLTDKQYIADTVLRGADGYFSWKGTDNLPSGVYLAVMKPENQFFQFLVTPEERKFTLETKREMQVGNITFKNGPDNKLFYDYLAYLESRRPEAEKLNQEKAAAAEVAQPAIDEKLNQLNKEVEKYQQQLVQNNPKTFTAAIVKANLPLTPPEVTGTEEEKQMQQWRWAQQHYFDNLDLGDPRMLRTPFFFQRVDAYVHKLQVQHPDTISAAIDEVLRRMKPAEENFKVYLIHFLNVAARSNIVGMDAVYVHLVDNYYSKGLAPWTETEQLDKIVENAKTLRPILIGKTAPDIRMQRRDGSQLSLHEVKAPYTIVYFWRYDCGHCKESTPILKEFYEKYKDKGVKIFAVCAKPVNEIEDCWKYVDENGIADWVQVIDPYMRSGYGKLYDVRSTPQIFVLDQDKKILSKRIGAEQLDELMQRILEEEAMKGKAAGK